MKKIRVYLDNCCYNRPFDDQNQIRICLESQAKIHIQNLIICGRIELVFSYMSVLENSDNPNRENSIVIADFFRHAILYVDPNQASMIEKSAERIQTQNIKNKDAIHIACAIDGQCDYFITTDDGILKKFKEKSIMVCSPIDFVTIFEADDA